MISLALVVACVQPHDDSSPAAHADPPDTDGDGLYDDDETAIGTDPLLVDTDGDTYWDSWELTEGKDPLDPDSRIYEGYWPYAPEKETLEDPGFEGGSDEGDRTPRFVAKDQNGEDVDLYDFALGGRPVVIDLSHMWCYYCQQTALWVGGQASEFYDENFASMDFYTRIPPLVASGELGWVVVLTEDYNGDPVNTRDVRDWAESFAIPGAPALQDPDATLSTWFESEYVPTLFLVDEDMAISMRYTDYSRLLAEVAEEFEEAE